MKRNVLPSGGSSGQYGDAPTALPFWSTPSLSRQLQSVFSVEEICLKHEEMAFPSEKLDKNFIFNRVLAGAAKFLSIPALEGINPLTQVYSRMRTTYMEERTMFKQLVRMVLFCSIIMLIGCPQPTGNKDTTAPSLAATQDGIRDADTTFQIRFTEAVQWVSGQTPANGITVAVNGASPAAVSSASINSDTRYVDISFPAVKGGDKVVIVIKQGFLQDAAGNKNSQLTMPTITVGAASSDNTPRHWPRYRKILCLEAVLTLLPLRKIW